jgi:hypothetical protein
MIEGARLARSKTVVAPPFRFEQLDLIRLRLP